MKYFDKSTKEVLHHLKVERTEGLSTKAAKRRLEKVGPNQLRQAEPVSKVKLFFSSFKEPIIIVLMVAIVLALLSALYDFRVTQDYNHGMAAIYEAIAIMILIFVNAFISFYQANSAQKSLDALQEMAHHHIHTLRDGNWEDLDTSKLVPGDIISVKMGDFIEGDVRWLKVSELQVNESHLTGEADGISKATEVLASDTDLGDRTNMGFSGSTVVNGSGIGVVVATGMQTELGKIADLLQGEKQQKTPIERNVNALTKKLMYVAGAIVLFTILFDIGKEFFRTGTINIGKLPEILSGAIALAVASIPDAMPVVLSIVLTIGATILARNNGLIKNLSSVETLGATSYIASDKTGTLTKNQMTVTRFWANNATFQVEGNGYEPLGDIIPVTNDADYRAFLEAAVLDNEAEIMRDEDQKWQPYGNPTDVSLVVLAAKAGITRSDLLEKNDDRDIDVVRVLPFDSTRKMMSVVIQEQDRYFVITKGAPDVILAKSEKIQLDDEYRDIARYRKKVDSKVLEFANNALRTLAVSKREVDAQTAHKATVAELEQQLTFLGIAGIIDPPREEVQDSVEILHDAGVQVVMITGDHAATARAIAYQLGIVDDKHASVIEGKEIEAMTNDELFEEVQQTYVYARVSPEHKQRIIKQLQRHGEVVAMTGDGINDAPALRAADIGVAMGINGTEVTKDAADLVLLDDKFTTIEKSVQAGRRIFANIRNFIRQELITNVAEVLALVLSVVLISAPIGNIQETTPTLTALMVLWVNMISDSLPSFALGFDEPEADLMRQKPRNTKASILDGMLMRIFIRGAIMGIMVFLAFVWAARNGMSIPEAQTIAFLTLVFGQLWHVFDARTENTLFSRPPFENGRLNLAVAFAAVSSIFVTLLPFFNNVMGTAPLSMNLYLAVIFLPAIPTFLLSGIKVIFKIKNAL
ncbi:cation-transporting P-type ATPase [Lactobacillus sp. CC-MHH1034]|uniref:cation-translocating P-type ATPase n=1 Tax=Agrilactobacillus fermenti TaxID=2586909 RepID=UPI001E5C137E|nr:cation-transporting P-type ATPase [Agrilactobacillus fermenti]MCD2255652.1 cation-transporting P-type ATPase [Agrilactobacillus fermenti]